MRIRDIITDLIVLVLLIGTIYGGTIILWAAQ